MLLSQVSTPHKLRGGQSMGKAVSSRMRLNLSAEPSSAEKRQCREKVKRFT